MPHGALGPYTQEKGEGAEAQETDTLKRKFLGCVIQTLNSTTGFSIQPIWTNWRSFFSSAKIPFRNSKTANRANSLAFMVSGTPRGGQSNIKYQEKMEWHCRPKRWAQRHGAEHSMTERDAKPYLLRRNGRSGLNILTNCPLRVDCEIEWAFQGQVQV